jgi:hypothetical protein
MSYTPISDETAQNYIDLLSQDANFAGLSTAAMLQYLNFGQHECAKISKENRLDFYSATQNMCTVTAPATAVTKITDGTKVLTGSQGYISAIDLTAYDIDSILGIQIGTLTTGNVLTSETSFDVLAGFVNDALCPNIAYCWTMGTLNIFCKTSVYAFVDTTLVNFWHYRSAVNITATTSKIDIASEFQQLAISLILRRVYSDKNTSLPQGIGQQIRIQCNNLNIQYPV